MIHSPPAADDPLPECPDRQLSTAFSFFLEIPPGPACGSAWRGRPSAAAFARRIGGDQAWHPTADSFCEMKGTCRFPGRSGTLGPCRFLPTKTGDLLLWVSELRRHTCWEAFAEQNIFVLVTRLLFHILKFVSRNSKVTSTG